MPGAAHGDVGEPATAPARPLIRLAPLARWCVAHRALVVGLWVAALVAAVLAARGAGSDFVHDVSLPRSDAQRASRLLAGRFPAQFGDSSTVVFHTRSGRVTDPPVADRMRRVFGRLRRLPHVRAVDSPYAGRGAAAIAPDGRTAFAVLRFDDRGGGLPSDAVRRAVAVGRAAATPALDIALGGYAVSQAERAAGGTAEAIGLAGAVLVLLATFGSVVASGLPVICALLALGSGLALVALASRVFEIADFSPQLAAMVGLGVGIDYALFIVTRFRAGLREGREVPDAVVAALDTAGRAVLFAGTTVIVALMGMFLLGVAFVRGLAVAASIAVLATMIASLTLLPALLALIGRRVDRLRLPLPRRRDAREVARGWERWSRFIQRRPWPAAIAATALLLVLCVPALSLRLGSADDGSDPRGSSTREAYDLLGRGFGPGFNGPLRVVVELPRPGATDRLAPLAAALRAEPGVDRVAPSAVNRARDTALLSVYPTSSPQSAATEALLGRLRGDVIPPLARRAGLTVVIGGATAASSDIGDVLARTLPVFVGAVVLVSALLLMAVFRSLLIPLKAAAMNLLSIGAAFGVVVAVFQWGWLGSLIGVDRSGPIESFLPVMLFAIVFGLSMDYEVFLLSRMHEEWERMGDASHAVARGLAATGRVVTAAASIMVVVFASFVLSGERVIKLFGLGLAVAVLLDAVVIRSVLVPAVMELLGRRAWWLPRPLERVLPRLAVDPAGVAAPVLAAAPRRPGAVPPAA